MTQFLIRLFVKDSGDVTNPLVREAYGKLAGGVGIVSNLLLFGLKMAVGVFTGSIAIMADAVNNLSDCASSVITLVGFKLSALPPDEKHPYGHARFEYISGLVVSFLIMAIGFEFFVSSLRKALRPEPVLFNGTVAAILAVSIAVKLWQGLFNRNIGRRIDSDTLRATAADSRNDVVTTAAVLAGAVAGHYSGLLLDGWLGMLVAAFVLISGVRLVIDTLNPLLGTAPDDALVAAMEEKILAYPSVLGLHDLIVHNYGPGRCFVSAHVEVPADQDILLSHDVIDNVERDFMLDLGIDLVVHMDPLVTDDAVLNGYRQVVEATAAEIDPVLSTHDFRMVDGKSHTNLIFDVVVPPGFALSDADLREELSGRIRQQLPGEVYCVVTVDRSYTSTRSEVR